MSQTSETISKSRFERLMDWAKARWTYFTTGVWLDPRRNWKVSAVKTLNLAVRSFMDSDLQVRAASLTYNTVLAVVPALAMVFAIGRGFGFQNLLQKQLYSAFPSQHAMVATSLKFVDSYLAQASEGIFVGVGIVFLLWTMISLLGNVEDAFNIIWDVKRGRTLWRKVTDYLAIFLILPILMIVAGGISLAMSTTLHNLLPSGFLSPAVEMVLDIVSYLFTCLFFTGAYMLIPNTKVKFLNALLAGVIAGVSFLVLQWLFLSGQIYVAKYNAIYGSFSFLPLFLLWLYFVWLITLIGAVLCYASQNTFALSFIGQIDSISPNYRRKVTIVVMALICRRFYDKLRPMNVTELARTYALPARLVKDIVTQLVNVHLLDYVTTDATEGEQPIQPAVPVETLTVGDVMQAIDNYGTTGFIPLFDKRFAPINRIAGRIDEQMVTVSEKTRFVDIPINISPLPATGGTANASSPADGGIGVKP